MNDVAIPFGRADDGRMVFPEEAERGKTYRCFGCENVRVFAVVGDLVTPHMRAVKGSIHTGALCRHLNDRYCKHKTPRIDLVDNRKLTHNIMCQPEPGIPPVGGPKNPGPPRKKPETLLICTSLPKFREYNLHLRKDFKLENGEMFSNTFVSLINAHLIMNDNASLGARGIEIEPDYAFPYRRTIRCVQKARRYQNGKRTAAQKVFDLEFATDEEFRIALDLLFVRNPDHSSKVRYLPRYRKAFIFGIWWAVESDKCHKECMKKCESEWVHCTGRQISEGINAKRQINVDEADLITYDFMK